MAKLKVKWICERIIEVNANDFAFSQKQLNVIAEEAANENVPVDSDTYDYEWVIEPKTKGSGLMPPDDYWFDSILGPVATNGFLILLKGFLLPPKVCLNRDWKDPSFFEFPQATEWVNSLIDKDFSSKQLHKGWFAEGLKPLREMQGFQILGDGPTDPGYMVLDENLIGLLMPCAYKAQGCFQFCGEAND